jgi:hypothetical protein
MKSRSTRLPLLLLVFALLFTQQGAAIHALSHLSESLPSHSRQDKQLPHSPACDECVAYAGVGNAVAASSLFIPSETARRQHVATNHPSPLFQAVRLYHARAPPVLV